MPTFTSTAARLCLFAAPAALLIVAAAPVAAQPQDETVVTAHDHAAGTTTRQMRVAYADLNLADARDQGRFERRVAAAADTVCADEAGTIWNKFSATDYSRCYRAAVASALTRLPAGTQPARD